MRSIVLTSLVLGLISLAGCQSNSVSYQVESQIGPHVDGPLQQCLVKITVIQVDPSGSRRLANPSTLVVLGKEAKMSVERSDGTAIDCKILIDQDSSFTSVSLSKKGKVFWSSEQTTTTKSEVIGSPTSVGKTLPRNKHDEQVVAKLEEIFNEYDSGANVDQSRK